MTLDLHYEQQLATTPSTMSVNDLLSRQSAGTLVLRPAFQRNMVWKPRQQALHIDSMLRGLPVPEIYLKTTTGPDGEEEYVVVDGQQRISACLDFVAGEFSLLPAPDSRPVWSGANFSNLAPELRAKFRGYKFIVRELPESVGESAIRAIFSRLNMTVEALEPQELRHAAYTGGFIKLVEDTASHPVFIDLGVFSRQDYLRRRSDEFASEVYLAVNAKTLPNKKEDLDEAYATFERSGFSAARERELVRRMGRAIRLLTPIAEELRKTRFRNKSDLYSLLYLLAVRAEHVSPDEEASHLYLERLRDFGTTVDEFRRAGDDEAALAQVRQHPLATFAASYWAGVARAASDRKSRVARHEALQGVLQDLFAPAGAYTLDTADEVWRNVVVEGQRGEELALGNLEEERRIAQQIIDEA